MNKSKVDTSIVNKEMIRLLVFNLIFTFVVILAVLSYFTSANQSILLGLLFYWLPHLILTEIIILFHYHTLRKGMKSPFVIDEEEEASGSNVLFYFKPVLYLLMLFMPIEIILFSLIFITSITLSFESLLISTFVIIYWLPTIIAIEPLNLPIFKKLKRFFMLV